VVAYRPHADIEVPAAVAALCAGGQLRCVWRNELGGLTFALSNGHRRFVKWAPSDSGIDLTAEARRLEWAAAHAAVPRVLGEGSDGDGTWMMTSAIPGESAVSDRWKADPRRAVTAIGRGLRHLHDSLPVECCPFSWSAEDRLAQVRLRASSGALDPANRDEAHRRLTVEAALQILSTPPEIDRLVVCHGDACSPNTLLSDDGEVTGHVDLGAMGVADRWADVAVATWSTTWNYGPGWEPALLDAYQIEADPERIRYYRLLWDLAP
jgi:kanamycin kinase